MKINHFIALTICCLCLFSSCKNHSNPHEVSVMLTKGMILEFPQGKVEILDFRISKTTPVMNYVSIGNKYILISLRIISLEEDQSFAVEKFILNTHDGYSYLLPGSWWKSKEPGTEEMLEAKYGGETYYSPGEQINLMFCIPKKVFSTTLHLGYEKE